MAEFLRLDREIDRHVAESASPDEALVRDLMNHLGIADSDLPSPESYPELSPSDAEVGEKRKM
jgi:hypothetical protein